MKDPAFRDELAGLTSAIRARKATTQHSHALILAADWFFYWCRPRTWRRAWPHLRAWLRVQALWPLWNLLRDFRREALALKPRRWPPDI